MLASGVGQLNRPHVPDFPGRDTFQGAAFHSARWDSRRGPRGQARGGDRECRERGAVHPAGRRAGRARRRSSSARPNWVMPRLDYAYSARAKWLFAHVPGLERLYRWWIYWNFELRFFMFRGRGDGWLARRIRQAVEDYYATEIADPKLRATLTPDYAPGCKRLLISDDYLPALRRPNVEVVTSGIERIAPEGVVTRDGRDARRGRDRLWDGLRDHELPRADRARGAGREEAPRGLARRRGGLPRRLRAAASRTCSCSTGPNTNLGHNSILFMIEAQVRYIVECVQELRAERARLARGADRGAGALQRRGAARARRDRLGHGLRQLVQDRVRPGHQQLEGLHARVLVAHAPARLERVPLRRLAQLKNLYRRMW